MLGIYNYTVILTYVGMLAGFTGITHALRGDLRGALICLLISGICDVFDGRIASTMERTRKEKRFGVQIDSLSDLVCFGVLPAVCVYTSCGSSRLSQYLSSLYVLCALIRLAWFNVDEEERQNREEGPRVLYYGLPVTSSALIVPMFIWIGEFARWPMHIAEPVLLLVLAVAFLTPFRIKKPFLHCSKEQEELADTQEPEQTTELKL